jgi:hypothetical protein
MNDKKIQNLCDEIEKLEYKALEIEIKLKSIRAILQTGSKDE